MARQVQKPLVAIYGLGMMGASLALALRARYKVLGFGRDLSKLKRAKRKKICDEVSVNLADLSSADIVILCMRAQDISGCFAQVLPYLKKGALVTDIGSTKFEIVQSCQQLAQGAAVDFIGSHPMTGSEKSGWQFAIKDLYKNATVVLTPTKSSVALARLQKLWKDAGAKTLVMPPDVHDILVAQTSHLPHILAGILSQSLARLNKVDANTKKILAGSFRDMTRIASADPEQWAQICASNQANVLGAIKAFADQLKQLVVQVQRSKNSQEEWQNLFSFWRSAKESLNVKSKK